MLSKFTLRRLYNVIVVYTSFYYSRLTGRTTHPGMPLSVSIEPTTACNLGCPECPSGLKLFERPTGNIDRAGYEKWLDEIARHVTYINFYFQGEPFIHPSLTEMIRSAAKRRIYTSTSTNAHFLSDEVARRTVESGLDRLIISVDGITQDVYEKYRIHGQLDKVLQGASNIIHWKKKLRSKTPHVIFQFLVVAPNEHQISGLYELADAMEVDEVRLKTAQVYNFQNGHELIPSNEKYSRYKKLSDGTYVVKNNLDDHCWRMWSSCVITWDGSVVPCCFDKDAEHQMGNLAQSSLKSIWNDKRYRAFREQLFKSRSTIDICTNCSEGTEVWARE